MQREGVDHSNRIPGSFETAQTHSADLNAARGMAVRPFNALNWKFEDAGPDAFTSSVSMGLASLGENVSVSLRDDTKKVRSTCSMPFQIIDWRDSEANIRKFLAQFNAS